MNEHVGRLSSVTARRTL